MWIEHPTLGAQADFIALPLTQLGDVQLYLYSLGAGDPSIIVAPGEIVSVVGFPFGLTAGGSLEEVAPIILKAEQIVIPDEVVDTVHEALLGVIEAKADIESLMELHRQNRVSHVAPYGTQPPKAR